MKHVLVSAAHTVLSAQNPVNVKMTDSNVNLGDEVRDRLGKGVAHFLYVKDSDGEVREAFGTLQSEIITKMVGPPKESTKEPSMTVCSYYDLTVKGFRSFKYENVIAIL
jgi:hypothetical protein